MRVVIVVSLALLLAACGSPANPPRGGSAGAAAAPAAAAPAAQSAEDVALAAADALIANDPVTLTDLVDATVTDRDELVRSTRAWFATYQKTDPYQRIHLGPVVSRTMGGIETRGATTQATVAITHRDGMTGLTVTLAETPEGWRVRDMDIEVTKRKEIK